MPRRRCFISYHHADQDEVDDFVRQFDHAAEVFRTRGLGIDMAQDIIDSTNTDYVMRRIRELYIGDSTITLLMMGKCTWARRYVDWELQASLKATAASTVNGLLGIKLKSFPRNGTFPERFNNNLLTTDNEAKWGDCYARWIDYPTTTVQLERAIEEAFAARATKAHTIVNPRDRFGYNRSCQ